MGKPLPKPKPTNERGIPPAPFVSSIGEYADNLDEATALLGELQEMLQKYQFMEMATRNRLKNLTDKLPNLRQTSESIEFLTQCNETFESQYALNDTVYAKATIEPTKTVWLWLGANVMLEFPLDEAQAMIKKKLEDANKGVSACEKDLEFLRENITTMEVNTARAINYQVTKRKEVAA